MRWKMLNDFVLVEVEAPSSTYVPGGLIVVPEQWIGRDRIGIVVGVGSRVKNDLRVGDRVFCDVYSELWQHQDNGKQHRIMREKNVLMILDADVDVRPVAKHSGVREEVENLDFRDKEKAGTVKWQNLD